MTRAELLARVKRDRPGESTDAEKNQWIDQLDEKWRDEVELTHEGAPMDPESFQVASWCADGTATESGITVTKTGNRVVLDGTATENVYIRISGMMLEVTSDIMDVQDWMDEEVPYLAETGNLTLMYTTTEPLEGVTLNIGDGIMDYQVDLDQNWFCGPISEDMSISDSMVTYLKVEDGTELEDLELLLILAPEGTEMDLTNAWRKLRIPEIDEEVYVYWLYSKIDYRLGEMARYNNDATMFNTAWDTAAKRWHREHMPMGKQVRHVVYGHPVPWRAWEDPLNQRRDWPRH